MRKVNLSKHLPGLFICISIICIFSALALPLADSAGTWTATGSLATGRQYHTATLLASGKVLVAGGQDIYGNALSECEIYDPSTGVWTEAASLATGRFYHTATLLPSGQVLVAGGQDINGNALSDCEIYDPSSRSVDGGGKPCHGAFQSHGHPACRRTGARGWRD